jgi:hypothetical protein
MLKGLVKVEVTVTVFPKSFSVLSFVRILKGEGTSISLFSIETVPVEIPKV